MPSELEVPATVESFIITRSIDIKAPAAAAFEALLDELGKEGQMPGGQPFPMVIEPWPGGRWFRDRGEAGGHKFGHLWGHVQVIKAPTLIEISGPLMMSYPATNHIQYRLTENNKTTTLTLTHRAFGLIPQEHMDGMPEGWEFSLQRVKEIAENNKH